MQIFFNIHLDIDNNNFWNFVCLYNYWGIICLNIIHSIYNCTIAINEDSFIFSFALNGLSEMIIRIKAWRPTLYADIALYPKIVDYFLIFRLRKSKTDFQSHKYRTIFIFSHFCFKIFYMSHLLSIILVLLYSHNNINL